VPPPDQLHHNDFIAWQTQLLLPPVLVTLSRAEVAAADEVEAAAVHGAVAISREKAGTGTERKKSQRKRTSST